VNVQAPYDVPMDTQFQVTVQRDNLQPLPEQLVIVAAQPGILAAPGSPASAGETVTILYTALGTVTPGSQQGRRHQPRQYP
jgi:hypothetical protein